MNGAGNHRPHSFIFLRRTEIMAIENQHRTLLLLKFLCERTGEQQDGSASDVLPAWEEAGIQAGRTSVYSAIQFLINSS